MEALVPTSAAEYFQRFKTYIFPQISSAGDGPILESRVLEGLMLGEMSEGFFTMMLGHVIEATRPELSGCLKKRMAHQVSSHVKLADESPQTSMFRMISEKASLELSDAIKSALDADTDSIICGSSVLAMARAPGASRTFADVDIFVKADAPGIKEIADILLSQEQKNIVPGMYSKRISPVNVLLLVEAIVGSLAVQLVIMVEKPKDVVANADLSCCRMFIDRDGLNSSVPQDIEMASRDEMMSTGTYSLDESRLKRQEKYGERGMTLVHNPRRSDLVPLGNPLFGMRDFIALQLWKTLRTVAPTP